jgi:gliding motility-associated-like protein
MKWQTFTYCLIFLSFYTGKREISAQDLTPPEMPVLKSVSVDTSNNNVNIFWEKSPSPDVKGYFLYYVIKSINGYEGDTITFVPSTTLNYTHNTSGLAGEKPILYSISAVDTAGNSSTQTPFHSTIYSSLSFDSCNNTLTLHWNKYLGWGSNISGYKIFAQQESGAFQNIAGIDARDTSFIIYEVKENTQYSFFVTGVKNDTLTSLSNIAAKFTYMPLPPENLQLGNVTVTGPSTVDLTYSFSSNEAVYSFALLRSSMEFSEFNLIKSFQNVSTSPQTISDSILTSTERFFFKIGNLNSCGKAIGVSNPGSNILLSGRTENDGKSVVLSWNPYHHFSSGTALYQVYRDSTIIATLSAMDTSYTDNLSEISGQNFSGKIIYRVIAIENGELNSSNSNFCELLVKSDIWVPNAFTPNGDGKNDEFNPYLSFYPDEYLMLIYDRSGIVIFSSESPDFGWDGRISGNKLVPEGVYVYHIQYSSFNGQKGNKTGHVSVFYPKIN